MNITRAAREAKKHLEHAKQGVRKKSRINPYPLLGIVLVIVAAILVYGGLLFFLW